jgi:hypothetical protein
MEVQMSDKNYFRKISDELIDTISKELAKKKIGSLEDSLVTCHKLADDTGPNTDDDVPLFYAKQGRIHQTWLYTKDPQAFIDWAAFVHPTLKAFPKDLQALTMKMESRFQLWYLLAQGVSLYTTLFRDPKKGAPVPYTYNGKTH